MKNVLLILSFISLPFFVYASEQKLHFYDLEFSKNSPLKVLVKAKLPISNGKIEMANWGHAVELSEAWAHFIKDLKVTGMNGQVIETKDIDGPKWLLDVPDNTFVNLSYSVELSHQDYDWRSGGGDDARPHWTGKNHFLITKALFIVSYHKKAAAEIKVKSPIGWNVTTAWDEIGEKQYRANNIWGLINNAMVVGDHQASEVGLSGMNVRVVLDDKLISNKSYVASILGKSLQSYQKVFQEIPEINYLIALRKDVTTDGEAFENSFNMIIKENDFEAHKITWANTLVHEMFHYWTNPLGAHGSPDVEWFKEGFTEYYASLTLLREEIIDYQLWFKKLEKYLSRYYTTRFRLGARPSLIEAGQNKIDNWFLVYGGGASLALALDIQIRKKTAMKKSLDDVMLALYKKFAGKKYTVIEMIEVFNDTTGMDLYQFFESYVFADNKMPNYEELLSEIGLTLSQFSDEFYIQKTKNHTKIQADFYNSLTNDSLSNRIN